ncbi:MAG: hypothetical protein ABI861_09540 [Panacibacter sp.]
MKLNIFTTKANNGEKLNDIGFRVILIPFFGIAIPVLKMQQHLKNEWLVNLLMAPAQE